MKRIIPILVLATLLCSCKQENSNYLPEMVGAPNEILVVSSDKVWQSAAGDSIKNYFTRELIGLPQDESTFKLLHIPASKFERHFGKHRNVIQIQVNPQIDTAKILFQNDYKSKTQQYYLLQAPDTTSLIKLFEKNKRGMEKSILKAEEERLWNGYKKFPAKELIPLFKEKYNLGILIPDGFKLNKESKDFIWSSLETKESSLGIIVFQDTLIDVHQFSIQIAFDKVNEVLEAEVPGPIDSTWMELDMSFPYVAEPIMLHDKFYTVQVRGLWDVVNDFMAGPYVLNVILDKEANRIIYAMGYVYYPIKEKRNMVRRAEAIINSIEPLNHK